jgi:phage protein D
MLDLTITYNRLDAEISRFAESLTLTERIGKAAGTLDITLCNADGRFTRDWAATKGDSLSVKLGDIPAEPYSIESVAVSSSPRTVTWQCKARPATTKAPSGRGSGSPPPKSGAIIDTRASWPSIASITLSGLLSKVCAECGLKAQYCPKKDVKLTNVVRYNESGWHLLERYAKKSGYSLRATATKVSIIAPKQSDNGGAPQVTVDITSSSIESLGNVDGIKPAKVQSRSYDPRSAEVVTSSAGDGDGSDIGVDFTLDDAVGLYEDIALSQGVHTLTVIPDSRYVAGAILGVVGASRMQITQMTYTRSADGETMQVEARAI